MIGDACVFALTQITNDFACEYGELVTRRAGPDIACHSAEHQAICEKMYEHLKNLGLNEFGFEDDLTQVPHGIWVKIQFGGLLAVRSLCEPQHENIKLDNIARTVALAIQQFDQLDEMPAKEITAVMRQHKSRRKKK